MYTRLSAWIYLPASRDVGVRYVTESGASNVNYQYGVPAGWSTIDIDLTKPGLFGPSVWSGKVIRVELALGGTSDRFTMELDWARLRRADAPCDPPDPTTTPVVKVVSPNEEGGADYATVSGDPWDFGGMDDVAQFGRSDHQVVRWRKPQWHHHPQRSVRRAPVAHTVDPRPVPPRHH